MQQADIQHRNELAVIAHQTGKMGRGMIQGFQFRQGQHRLDIHGGQGEGLVAEAEQEMQHDSVDRDR